MYSLSHAYVDSTEWLSTINHPIFLEELSHLICIYDAFSVQQTAYSNKCTHCEYTACISVRARTYLRDKAWYSDIGVSAIRCAVSYYSCHMDGLGMATLPELRPSISICHTADVREGLLERFVFECTPLLVEKNIHHDKVITWRAMSPFPFRNRHPHVYDDTHHLACYGQFGTRWKFIDRSTGRVQIDLSDF